MPQNLAPPGKHSLLSFNTASENNAWLAAIIASSRDAIVSKTLDGTITSWNPAAERMFGFSADEIVGQTIRKLVPNRLQHEEDAILSAIRKGEIVDQMETVRLHKSGAEVPISVTISPILDEQGKVVGASKIARDISKEIEARKQLEESEARFRTMADNVSQLAWMADRNGLIFWYNKRWFDYTGTTLSEMEGWGWKSVHHPDHIDRVVDRIQHSWDTGEVWEDTFPLRSKTGEYRWFLSRAMPIRNEEGQIKRWFGTNTDITEERERQEEIAFLMGEINHRSKNLLTMVQSIARYTGRDVDPQFISNFSQRLHSLAASHDLLLKGGWRGMSLEDLVRAQLRHLDDLIGERIRLTGPEIWVDAKAAQSLGMALFELATNAAKYGALSNETGAVDVNWSLTISGDDPTPGLNISWQESGGPPVSPPTRRGFGSVVIERMCKSAFSSEITLDFAQTGLTWTLAGKPGIGLIAMPAD
ncbi:MAG: histidine kinase [Ponticaulis sp.]|nr:histidine kinase [Ponticaulis sp.]|tara:strand:- start:31556 stop:32977 length:1422 start_codon:yes stop_codon:yes gene_type:complete